MLTREQKEAIVAEVAEVARQAQSAVAVEYRGLTVAEMTELRAAARRAGVYLKVVKNTLARRALEGTGYACLRESLGGPLMLAFSREEPGAAARIIRDFAKDHEQIVVRAVALPERLLTPQDLEALATLPTREEALARLLAVMRAPVEKLARTLKAPVDKLVRTVAAVRDQKQAA